MRVISEVIQEAKQQALASFMNLSVDLTIAQALSAHIDAFVKAIDDEGCAIDFKEISTHSIDCVTYASFDADDNV